MRDLDERVQALAELDRIPLINALIAADAEAQRIWRRGSRAKRDSSQRYQAEEAKEQTARYGRIIFFLRYRTYATGSTEADLALCNMLEQKLSAKGQWVGEYTS